MKYLYLVVLIAMTHAAVAQTQQEATHHMLEKARKFVNARQPDSAISLADKAWQYAIQLHDTASMIKALGYKGKGYFYQNKFKEASDQYFRALRLCRPVTDEAEVAYLYGEIGYVYYQQGQFNEAKRYYRQEIAIRRRLQGNDSVGNQLINLSVMCQQMQQYDTALMLLREVGDILTRYNNPAMRGYYLFNTGALQQLIGRPDSTKYYYEQAYDVWKAVGKESEIFKVTFNLGFLAYSRKNYSEAMSYYKLAEASAARFGSLRDIAHVYGTMAEAYATQKDYKNAYDYLYRYSTLNDSANAIDVSNYMLKLDKQYQTEKNKEKIREQEQALNTASLEVQKQRSNMLLVVLVLVLVLFVAAVIFAYLTFQRRLQKEVDEAKNKFFANVAHEIRTPLSMIQGPLKVLQGKVDDPSLVYHLNMAQKNTSRLNDLIDQMLDISKIDAAKYKLNESIGSLDGFLQQIAEQYAARAMDKNITFTRQVEVSAGNVMFDKDALEKIAGNLLGNAIKYTPAGGVVGMEAYTRLNGNEEALQLVIWDNGPGIPKDEQHKIFDRFYRASADGKGVGIGLSLVKELVELMHGHIVLESERGKGAVFTIILPLKQKEASVVREGKATGAAPTILLVEDDKDTLDFNKTLLSGEGFNIITAVNGNDGWAVIKNSLPDLVVTDLMMPGKDGLTILKDMRGNALTEHIPVIILSAKASAESKREGVAHGAQGYLSKPYQPDELAALVRNQISLLQKQRTHYQQRTEKVGESIEERFAGSDPFTRKCFSIIQEHLDDGQLSVEMLADKMNVNRSHFQRKIKTLTGFSPSELIRTIRLEKAKELLEKKEGNITEIAYATGFSSQSYFTKCFSEHFGHPPSQVGENR